MPYPNRRDNGPASSVTSEAGDSIGIALGKKYDAGRLIRSDGSDMIESDMIENGNKIKTKKNFFAKKIKTESASIQIGSSLTLSNGGSEILQQSFSKNTNPDYALLPSKNVDFSTGTGSNFTTGRTVGISSEEVFQGSDILLSDDVSASIGENTVAGKARYKVLVTGGDSLITKIIMRFNTVQEGIRIVVRIADENGPVVFETKADETFEDGEGFTSQVYSESGATETIAEFSSAPLVQLDGITYHVTIESALGPVVMLGDILNGEYIPYFRRDIQSIVDDPVVAGGVITDSVNLVLGDSDWYTYVFVDATDGNKTVTLPSGQNSLGKALPIIIYKTDSSVNTITVLPFGGESISGESNVIITSQHESATFVGDGVAVRLINREAGGDLSLEFTQSEKDKLASITGGRYLGVFTDLAALQAAHPTGVIGDSATVTSPTANLFYWDGSIWADSGTGYVGDMLKSTYDPASKNTSAFSMSNMDETATAKIFTDLERIKLAGIFAGAEVNVQSDWNQVDTNSDDYIKNKPTIPVDKFRIPVFFTNASNLTAGTFLMIGEVVTSETMGFISPQDLILKTITISRTDVDAAVIEVLKNGVVVSSTNTSALSTFNDTLNVSFSQLDKISVRNKITGSNTMSDVIVALYLEGNI